MAPKRFPLLLAPVFLLSARAPAAPAAPVDTAPPLAVVRASAKTLASLLAQSCSESGWQAFSVAAQGAGLLPYTFGDQYEVWTTHTSLRVGEAAAAPKVDAKIDARVDARVNVRVDVGNRLELSAAGRTYVGADACELIAAYFKVVPTMDPRAALVVTAAALAGTSQLTQVRAPADFSAVTAALLLSLDTAHRGSARLDLNRVLDANFSVKCSEGGATIQTALHKIVINRGHGPAKMDAFDKETAIALPIDKKSVFAMHAGQYLAQITARCKRSKDAETLTNQATDTFEAAQTRAASLEPTGGDRQPATSK